MAVARSDFRDFALNVVAHIGYDFGSMKLPKVFSALAVLALVCAQSCKNSAPQPKAAPAVAPASAPVSAPACQTRVLVIMHSHSPTGSQVADFTVSDINAAPVGHALPADAPIPEFVVPCDDSVRGENTQGGTPQVAELCDPEEQPYFVDIRGKDTGLFDLEIRAEPRGSSGGVQLSCNYVSSDDKKYHWIFHFVRKPKPVIYSMNPNDDPLIDEHVKKLEARE